MDKSQKVSIVVVSAALVFFVVTAVTASLCASDTPLYTMRMEQASHKMGFLPTTVNSFTYVAEGEYTLSYAIEGYCSGVRPLDTGVWSCVGSTCGGDTCEGSTCELTCPESCYGTCNDPTCPATCPATCNPTCDLPHCEETVLGRTCWVTLCIPCD